MTNGRARADVERGKQETSTSEWVVAAFSTLIVLGAIVFMLYEVAKQPYGPPVLVVRVRSTAPSAAGYVVEFDADNMGRSTAANVQIEGTLRDSTGIVETARTVLDYVPGHSRRGGGLYFDRDPRRYELAIEAKGYERP